MKQISFLIVGVLCFAFTLGGCPDPNEPDIHIDPIVQQTFPEFLVGSWKADNSEWGLTFDAEGKLTSMTHFGGMVFEDVSLGILEEEWMDSINAVYILGPQPVAKYDPATRELSVHIVVEHYKISFPTDSLEGSFDDTLTGPVEPDNKIWNVMWRSHGTIVGTPVSDPNDTIRIKPETFRKLIPEQIK